MITKFISEVWEYVRSAVCGAVSTAASKVGVHVCCDKDHRDGHE